MKNKLFYLLIFIIGIVFIPNMVYAENFKDTFFSKGNITKPETPYYNYISDGALDTITVWVTQPEEIVKLTKEQKETQKVLEKYNLENYRIQVQTDMKFDDGDWHYNVLWDKKEEQEGLPNYMLYQKFLEVNEDDNNNVIKGNVIESNYYENNKDNDGFLYGLLSAKTNGDGNQVYRFDMVNHSYSFRTRYVLSYTEKEKETQYIMSDWSDVVIIGKDSNQKELVKPEKLDTIELSDLKYIGNVEGKTNWEFNMKFKDSIFNADKYYSIVNNAFEPLVIETQYRVNGGEWKDEVVANATWIYDGVRGITVENAKEDDTVEIRVRVKNNVEEGKDSEWVTISNKTGELSNSNENKKTEGKSCLLGLSICCTMFLGISICIWILIIIIILLLIIIIKLSKNKKKQKEQV